MFTAEHRSTVHDVLGDKRQLLEVQNMIMTQTGRRQQNYSNCTVAGNESMHKASDRLVSGE